MGKIPRAAAWLMDTALIFLEKGREVRIEEFDDEKFIVEYCKAVIKGWKGLKYSYLEALLLVDISGLNPEDCLPFTQDNAELLMKNANDFDTWVTETVGDLENFTKSK